MKIWGRPLKLNCTEKSLNFLILNYGNNETGSLFDVRLKIVYFERAQLAAPLIRIQSDRYDLSSTVYLHSGITLMPSSTNQEAVALLFCTKMSSKYHSTLTGFGATLNDGSPLLEFRDATFQQQLYLSTETERNFESLRLDILPELFFSVIYCSSSGVSDSSYGRYSCDSDGRLRWLSCLQLINLDVSASCLTTFRM